MATSSIAAGYLVPVEPIEADDDFADILHDVIVGVTGLAGDLVRPRWQPEPPTQPDFNTNWAAFGVVRTESDVFSYQEHDPEDEGSDIVERDHTFHVLHSFYGPLCHGYCEMLRDGLAVAQNRDVLAQHDTFVIEVQEATVLPALLKQKWVRRVDVTVLYRRRISRTYPVRTIQSVGQTVLDNEHYLTNLNVPQP